MATKKSSKRASAKKSSKANKAEHVSEKAPVEEVVLTDTTKSEGDKNDEFEAKEETGLKVVEAEEKTEADDDHKKTVKEKKPTAPKAPKASLVDNLADINPTAMLAELFGTFVLAAAVLRLATNNNFGAIAISLVFAVLVVVFGAISGAHLNPAITIAAWVNRKINGAKAFAYIVAQVVGASLAVLVVSLLTTATYDLSNDIKQLAIQSNVVTEEEIAKDGGVENWAKKYLEKNGQKVEKGKTAVEMIAENAGLDKNRGVGVDVSAKTKVYTQPSLAQHKEWGAMIAEFVGSIVFGVGVGFALFNKKKSAVANGVAMGFGMLAGLTVAGATAILNPALAIAVGAYHMGGIATVLWPIAVYVLAAVLGMLAGVSAYRLVARNSDNSDEFEA